jgi:hypothetical protein
LREGVEEEVREVEREVEVEKSNIRAMKVVCSLGAIPGTLPMTRGVQPFA